MFSNSIAFYLQLEAREVAVGFWLTVLTAAYVPIFLLFGLEFAGHLFWVAGGAHAATADAILAITGWISSHLLYDAIYLFCLLVLMAGAFQGYALHVQRGFSYRLGFGWTVLTLFVPLYNLVRPWRGLAEIDTRLRVAAVRDAGQLHGEETISRLAWTMAATQTFILVSRLLYNWREDSSRPTTLLAILLFEIACTATFAACSIVFLRDLQSNLRRFRARIGQNKPVNR